MANISAIKLPNGTTYDIKDSGAARGNIGIFYGTCDTAAATATKAVTCTEFTASDLKPGAVINVFFSITNSAAVADLQLNVNGTGAKNIKYIYNGSYNNIPSAGYIKLNQIYQFTYDGTYWVIQMIYNTDTTPIYLRHYNNIKARKAITAESLIVGDATGYEKVGSGVTFDITYPIVWCTGDVAINASNYANMFLQYYDRNMQTGIKSGYTSTANKIQYLVTTIDGNIATIDSTIITDTLPTTDNGKVYIELGKLGAQSTGANYFFLYPAHHFWWFKNGKIRQYGDYGHTINSDVPANAVFTDTDTKVNMIARGTTKSYLLGTTTAPTSSNQAVSSVAETGVYFDTTAGTLVATTFKGALTGTASGNLTSSSTLSAAKLSGAIPSAVTATTQASTDNSTKIATTAYVTTAIANLPEPMLFKGSVGTGGTVTSLPTAAASNEGWTYKVITALSSPAAKVGDTVISNGSEWVVIPSGDEPSGTVTSVGISNATNGGLTVSGSPITSSGTITIGHSNVLTNAQTTQAVYPIKIDKNGHISAYGSAVTIPTVPSSTGSATTGITASTTATKTTLGTAFTIPNVTSAGSASSWVFEEITIPNVTSVGSASTWTFEEKTIPNVTSVGSASTWAFTSKTVVTGVTFAMDTTDTKKLKITTSTDTVYSKSSGSNGTAPTLGTAIKVQSKSGGGNGTAPTLGTAIKVQSKKSGANGSAPTLGTAFTVPNVTGNTSATVSITDNGHTHII